MDTSRDWRGSSPRGVPLYLAIRDELAKRIASQEWKRGETLPSEDHLAAHYTVAVGTVRRAVEELVNEGLLQRVQGVGTFVRRPDFSSSLLRFLRFRIGDGRNAVPRGEILSKQTVDATAQVAVALKINEGEKCIYISRVRVFDGKPIIMEDIWLSHKKFEALMQIPNEEFGDLLYPFYEEICGEIVCRAQETLRVSRSKRNEDAGPVVVIERVAYSLDGTPLEWRVSECSADDFSYRIDI